MKQEFSASWVGSKRPGKQRKYLANAPLHLRNKLMSANLAKDLRKKYGMRNIPLRKGDQVKIMVGEFKKRNGKVVSVDLKKLRVTIEGMQRKKKDGSKIEVYFHPSNLQILELNLDDKKRMRRKLENVEIKTEAKKEERKTESKSKKNESGEKKNAP